MAIVTSVISIIIEFIEFLWYMLGEYWTVVVIIAFNLTVYFVFGWIGQQEDVRSFMDQPITNLTIGQVIFGITVVFGLYTLMRRK